MTNDKSALRRIKVAAGLRDLARFIETNLDLPVPARCELSHSVTGETDDAERAEVDRIGRILREPPGNDSDPDHYVVSRSFGPVTYTAIAITRRCMERYAEKWRVADSYAREKWGEES